MKTTPSRICLIRFILPMNSAGARVRSLTFLAAVHSRAIPGFLAVQPSDRMFGHSCGLAIVHGTPRSIGAFLAPLLPFHGHLRAMSFTSRAFAGFHAFQGSRKNKSLTRTSGAVPSPRRGQVPPS